MWCIAALTPEYLARMEDVLALDERPVDPREPVVCLDERPLLLHADVRAPRPPPRAPGPRRQARP